MEKNFKVEITKSAINHSLNIRDIHVEFLTKKEFLNLKKKANKDKKNKYHFTILSGQNEPLLFTEKLKVKLIKFNKAFLIEKSIKQMQDANIKRDYIHKKYFWIILIITAIISALIGKFLG
ncbi:MAG: hypothetical protein AAB347_08220 [Bacteroidota bacterium]